MQTRSPTVYLDTANWIDLANRNSSSVEFERAVCSGRLRPVLSFVHLLEIAKQRHEGWRNVAKYIDLIRSKGTTHWALLRDDIERAEAEAAFTRFLGTEPPRIRPFRDSLVETLPDDPRDPITDDLRNESVENQVERLQNHPLYLNEYLPERNDVFPNRRRVGTLRKPEERILDYVPTSLPISGIYVGGTVRREFADQVDFSNLPAFSMAVAYNQGWVSQSQDAKPSDFEDLFHLAGLAYCDVSFADTGTCEILKQGHSRIIPRRNRDFNNWVATL